MVSIPRLVITPGEPAGVGPDVILQAATLSWPAELLVIYDVDLLAARAKELKIPVTFNPADISKAPEIHQKNHLKILPVSAFHPCKAGQLNPLNAAFVMSCLEKATDYCLQNMANALVTGPVQKALLTEAGFHFTGHTEFLKSRCHSKDVIMLFVVNSLKVALVTTHLPLRDVPKTITIENLRRIISLLHNELQNRFGIENPKILVTGLNPHAGESGHLGHEEIDIIQPVLKECQEKGMHVEGPIPADTVFTEYHMTSADAILAMYHDQALPVVKYIDFRHAVNVTLGLPFIRTSVDHGTALNIAGSGKADAGSLISAIQLALDLTKIKNGSNYLVE